MALINPSNLYSGEAERFNSQPSVNMAVNLMAKRQAREDALDKHYSDLPNTINDKGVRDADIPVLHQKIGEIQQYYMQHKDQIKKGTTPEAYNYSKMFRDASAIPQESINRTKTSAKIAQLRGNSKYNYIFNDPTFIDKVAAHEKSVLDPDSKAINFDQLTLPPEPVNYPKFIKEIGGDLKYNLGTPQVTQHPTEKGLKVETITPELGNDAKEVLKTRAIVSLHNNPSFAMDVDKLETDPTSMVKMNELYKKNFGKPIPLNQNGGFDKNELATAYALSLLPPPQVKSRNIPNDEYKRQQSLADRKELMRLNSALIEGRTRRNPLNGLTYNNGNVLDIIGEVEPVEVTYKDGQWGSKKGLIKDGVVYDENNNPYTGKVTIKQGNVPAMVKSVLAKQKINLDNPLDDAEIISNGGTIEGLKHRNAGLVGRPEVEQFQRQYDQERKGEALNFGRTKAPSNTQPTKKPTKGKLY